MIHAINGVFRKRIIDNIGETNAIPVIAELLTMVDRLRNEDRFEFHWKNKGRHYNGIISMQHVMALIKGISLYLFESEYGPSSGPVAAIAAPRPAVLVDRLFAYFDKTRLSEDGKTIKTLFVVIH